MISEGVPQSEEFKKNPNASTYFLQVSLSSVFCSDSLGISLESGFLRFEQMIPNEGQHFLLDANN